MNVFGLDINNLDSEMIKEVVMAKENCVDWLPGIPEILTRAESAMVLSVSTPTIDRLIQDGVLPEVCINSDDSGILKRDLITYIQANFLVNRPVLDNTESVLGGTKSA